MPNEPLVVVDGNGAPADDSREIMNISRMMVPLDLDTVDEKGKRESLLLTPGEKRVVTGAQFRSVRLQRLMSGPNRCIVDTSASKEKRLEHERNLGLSK
jgi:hypothetical protein